MTSVDHRQLELLPNRGSAPVTNEDLENQVSQTGSADVRTATSQAADICLPAVEPVDGPASSIGQRLRAERERRGWSCEDVASRLKLQARVIRLIEQDDYSDFSHAVYLRGYLTSYARLLDIPVALAERVVAEASQPTPLVSTGRISRSRYLLDRYSVSATYLILTGLVIGPAVWLATHGGLEQNLARTVMLDGPTASLESAQPVAGQDDPARANGIALATGEAGQPADSPAATTAADGDQDALPIVASMAPFSSAPPPAAPAAPAIPAGQHSLTLKLKQSSWVEITTADGEKLEYGLLAAGTERQYSSDSGMTLRIGNAHGAEVTADGKPVDLAPFQRANVAHLRLFGEGNLATRIDS
jgi:cytoskeleton protein RodZ